MIVSSRSLLAFAALSCILELSLAQTQHFYSNPNLAPPTLVIDTNNASATDTGLLFFTPFQVPQPAPLLYDQSGVLIWDGSAITNGVLTAHDLTVCEFNQTYNLCLSLVQQEDGYGRGSNVILDDTYTIVSTVNSGNGLPGLDQHEFRAVGTGQSALVTIYAPQQYDTTPYGIAGVTWIMTGVFQELDLVTGKVLFQWSSIDHVPVSQSYVLPNTTDVSGDGQTDNTAWDYFHINSVDKTIEGNYLVSARHVKTIYLISGIDGSIIWQLGGKNSSFAMNYGFNFQHHARVRAEFSDRMTISLYDNGADDNAPPPGQTELGYEMVSSGIVAEVYNETMTSTINGRYYPPGMQLSKSQGSLQFLPNGNRYMGMGSLPYVAEFTSNGTGNAEVVYSAHLAYDDDNVIFSSYRNFKYPWTAKPAAAPTVFGYAQYCTAKLAIYASWNGATDVAGWQFSQGQNESGPFAPLGDPVPKTGFETVGIFDVPINAFAAYVLAIPLDRDNKPMAQPAAFLTFVPAASLAASCTPTNCGPTVDYSTAARQICPVTA